VESGFIRDNHLKIKLLNDAYQQAARAEDDVMQRPWGVNVEETPHGLHAIASSFIKLDRISLQTRAVRDVLAMDPLRARKLFELIQLPSVAPLQCNESRFFSLEPYYAALTVELQHGFSSREIGSGQRAAYVSSILKNIKSHWSLIPATQMLNTVSFSEYEYAEILESYAASIRALDADPQGFSILLAEPDLLFDAILKLISLLEKNGINSRPLLEASREYIVLNLNEPTCDGAQDPKGPAALPVAVLQFNEKFGAQLTRANLGPINASEITKEKRPRADNPPPSRWNSQVYSEFVVSLQRLTPPANLRDADTSESVRAFVAQTEDLLTKVTAWSNEGEPETEFFHQKAIIMEGLTERTIGTSLHTKVRDRFLDFLKQYTYEQINSIDWFFYVKELLAADVRTKDARDDLEALLNSQDPVLSNYARLQLLLQTTNSGSVTPSTDTSRQAI
jgi:hypothetical protein